MDGMRGSPTLGRVLCINSGAGLDQEKPPRQLIDETVAALVKQHEIGVVMVQVRASAVPVALHCT